ncbi:Flagellar assembly protein T, C-terminal domain [Allopseudospirillum japonicum]|uniref:Flagellar assembly protein T, C-terminal domain n=1 Tax=Allopseudospirillum japonicum TaxID=64971 RepID=A0A1H6RMB4_9GAMM|nr:flagellar assembly protein T N-terminal domain-containing protein [Allopseudospirillum japonicum]SEI56958.1 Flagellar assembly protein T, C-terminal domain [Allopseudospirillum japonicum]
MRNFIRLCSAVVLCFSVLVSLPAHAIWIEATGSAMIQHQDLISARRAAIRDAIAQATLQGSASVSSHQRMQDGAVSVDNLSVSSEGRVRNLEVLHEQVRGNVLYLSIRAEVVESDSCGGEFSNGYQRSVAISSFHLDQPAQASMGGLADVIQSLPRELIRRMENKKHLRVLDAVRFQVQPDPESMPTHINRQNQLTDVLEVATQMGTQYVISGAIRSMAMVNPRLAQERPRLPGLIESIRYDEERFLREFKLDLYIYEGFSGALVGQRQYKLTGHWLEDRTLKTGFATPGFWGSEYGLKIDQLLDLVAMDAHQLLGCQPFMTRILRTQEKNLYLEAGSSSGLQPGDTLSLYRISTFFDAQQRAYREMESVDMVVTLKKVQPNFSVGEIPALPVSMNIQQGDIVVAW